MTLRNDTALFGWWFLALWWVGVATFTWIGLRDGVPEGESPTQFYLFLGAFWVGGGICTLFAMRDRRVRLDVMPDGTARLEESGLFGRRSQLLAGPDILAVGVEETRDSDGAPYFECRLTLRDGREVKVAEGHRRAAVAEKAARLQEALRR
ncbi:hypothetical protein [Falsiroseomonas sp. HW251]|uniref:hypothetical protein n=1 Tax=Falsiroseomonas sp. HW251 TaxID=3390998 RepID=UPI003D310CD0